MADDGEDLVSKVSVTGAEESAAKLDAYATEGAAAFNKLDKAATKAASGVDKAAKNIEKSATDTSKGLGQLSTAAQLVAPNFDLIERGAKSLVTSIRSGIPSIASFVTRLTAAGGAAVAAGVGILKLAQNVAKGASTQENALDKQTAAQVAANTASAQGEVAAINLESSQRQLFGQLQRGEISFEQYSKSLTQLNRDFTENQRVSAQTAAAQENLRLENARLQKQAADTKAFQAQVDMFGGPLLSSLIALGNQATIVFTQFQQSFGPAIAQGVDLITKTLQTNGTAISAFFTSASAKISAFLAANGPAITQAFNSIGSAITIVFDGVIAALPGLLSFFNNTLVPAVQAFGAVLNVIAATINTVFGTQLTGGAIVFLVILGQMTGAFLALINVIRIFIALGAIIAGLPFGAVLLAIVATIGVLLFLFPQLRDVAAQVFDSIVQAFNGMVAGAKAAGENVIAAWNAVLEFFKTLGQGIVDAFNSAIATVSATLSSLLASAKATLQPILDLLRAIASLSASATAGDAAGPGAFAGGGHIRGTGTGTSDSVPIWASNGEFMVKAKSVGKYGLGLLHAINNGTFKMPRFNAGGLISSMINPGPRLAYADGGEVTTPNSMRPLNLNLFGETFNGLMAPEDVGQRLTKFAVARQNKSAGRKPAWVGRGRN